MYDSLEIIQRQNYKSIPTSLGCFYFLNRFLLDLEYCTVAPYSIFFCKLCCDHNASEFVCCTKEYYIYILSRNVSSIKEWDTRRPPTLSWTSLLGSSPGHMQSGRRSQIWSRKLKGLKAICSYLFLFAWPNTRNRSATDAAISIQKFWQMFAVFTSTWNWCLRVYMIGEHQISCVHVCLRVFRKIGTRMPDRCCT